MKKIARFESESDLVRLAKEIVAPARNGIFGLADEFDCSDGIADLVLYRLRPNLQRSQGLQHLSPRWAAALHALPYRKGFTADWFAATNLITRRRALQALNEYQRAGFCKPMVTKGLWIKTRQPQPLVTEIYAVEAKLRAWKRALAQASRYRAFSHESWVLLDAASIKPALAGLDLFVEQNVGLATLSTEGTFLRHYVPEKKAPTDAWRYWLANVLIARAVMQGGGDSKS